MSNSKKRAAEDAAPAKKTKKRKSKHAAEDENLDSELGLNTLFAKMDSQLLADYHVQKLARFGTDLSPVELSDLALSAATIKDTTSWQKTRSLDNLPTFLEEFAEHPESLSRAQKKNGMPHTIVVAGAGLRAADLTRALRKLSGKDSLVAKLFAKHMKVEEQVTLLKNKKIGVGVGTPARLMELIDNGSLSLNKLQRLVVDASHIDQKKRGVMDMKDTMMPLAKFLARKEFKDRYGDEKKPLDLLFY
ncbi:U3-90S pre-ribosomal complex subunit domain-containing protein [Trichoderma evansii]